MTLHIYQFASRSISHPQINGPSSWDDEWIRASDGRSVAVTVSVAAAAAPRTEATSAVDLTPAVNPNPRSGVIDLTLS